MVRFLTAILVFAFVVQPGFGQLGKLEQIRKETGNSIPDPPRDPERKTSSDDSKDSDDSDSIFGGLLGEFFGAAFGEAFGDVLFYSVFSPFVVPNHLIEGRESEDGANMVLDRWFQRYPYDEKPGWMFMERIRRRELEDPEVIPPEYLRRNSFRMSFEAGSDFRNVDRLRGELWLETSEYRVGIHATADYFRERLDCGCYDDTVLGTVNFTVRFAQNERIQMHTGFGLIALVDDRITEAGFNWQYGLTVFPMQPFSGFLQVELGTLGKAFQLHTRAGLGIHWRWAEGMFGFDYRRIGSVEISGPFAGLRFWF